MEVGSEVTAREGLSSVEIGEVGGGQDETEWVAESGAGDVGFGGEVGAGLRRGEEGGGLYAPYAPRPVAERVSVSPERRGAGAVQVALKTSVL